jgi:large subunit ribosomal protein L15
MRKWALNELPAVVDKKIKRVGRGHGSGLGKTCGRGVSGQKSRSGASVDPRRMGSDSMFIKSTPKIHIMNNHAPRMLCVSVDFIVKRFGADIIDMKTLISRLNISFINYSKLKVFGDLSKLVNLNLTRETRIIELKNFKR